MISTVLQGSIGNVRHLWPEPTGFRIYRPDGLHCYTFIHFHQPVRFLYEGEYIITKPHACILIAPHVPHDYTTIEPLINDWIHFDDEFAKFWTDCGLEFNKFYYPETYNYISENMQIIEYENQKRDRGYTVMISSAIAKIFTQLSRSLSVLLQTGSNGVVMERMKQLRQEVFSRLSENWTIQRMADTIHVSKAYINKYYIMIYGVSPVADLATARIFSAQQLLSQTNKSVREIATDLGYSGFSQFSRQFKHITGVSPTDYRKKR